MPDETVWICPNCFEMNTDSKITESSIQCFCCLGWFSWYEVEEVESDEDKQT